MKFVSIFLIRIHSTASLPSMKSVTPQEHKMLNEQFWDKNKRLARPTSPHLTIYKPQMTSLLSVTHRGTGLAQSVILTGFAVGAIASNSTFPIFLAYLQSWKFGGALIFLGKFALAWPVTYHLFNGLRHLVSLSIIPKYIHLLQIKSLFYYFEKNRQIVGGFALPSQNVNKLSRFFFLFF